MGDTLSELGILRGLDALHTVNRLLHGRRQTKALVEELLLVRGLQAVPSVGDQRAWMTAAQIQSQAPKADKVSGLPFTKKHCY